MRPIPVPIRERLQADPFMKTCCYTGESSDVSWEHCWTYAGRQINEWWAIVPLRRDLNVSITQEIKDYCRWISLQRATPEDLAKYPKKDWTSIKAYLDSKFN